MRGEGCARCEVITATFVTEQVTCRSLRHRPLGNRRVSPSDCAKALQPDCPARIAGAHPVLTHGTMTRDREQRCANVLTAEGRAGSRPAWATESYLFRGRCLFSHRAMCALTWPLADPTFCVIPPWRLSRRAVWRLRGTAPGMSPSPADRAGPKYWCDRDSQSRSPGRPTTRNRRRAC